MQRSEQKAVVQPVVMQTDAERQSTALQQIDRDAREIGDLYRRSRVGIAESMQLLVEAGRRLAEKKTSLPHGQWLPWLEMNTALLGFSDITSTPQRLMKAAEKANSALRGIWDADAARAISREIWGNAPKHAQARRIQEAAPVLDQHPNVASGQQAAALPLMRRLHQEVIRDTRAAEVAEALSADERHEIGIHAAAIAAWVEELLSALEA